MVQRLRVELAKRFPPATVKITASYFEAICRGAFAAGRIGRDPTVGLQAISRRGDDERVGARDVPSRAEVAAIWHACPAPFRAAVALGTAGLRMGRCWHAHLAP